MIRDTRWSGVLRVLLHRAQRDAPVTFEVLAKAMETNPVVLCRLMTGLRDQRYVQSAKGRGGGWTLTCDLAKVALRLVRPRCLPWAIAARRPAASSKLAVTAALGDSHEAAESLLLARHGDVTLASLCEDVRDRLAVRSHGSHTRPKTRAPKSRRLQARVSAVKRWSTEREQALCACKRASRAETLTGCHVDRSRCWALCCFSLLRARRQRQMRQMRAPRGARWMPRERTVGQSPSR